MKGCSISGLVHALRESAVSMILVEPSGVELGEGGPDDAEEAGQGGGT